MLESIKNEDWLLSQLTTGCGIPQHHLLSTNPLYVKHAQEWGAYDEL